MTNDTCGPLFDALSPSADLQRSLENRLRARLDANGSPEYALTWKHWPMQSGPPICALRASGHRISDSDCGGWPTGKASDWKGDRHAESAERELMRGNADLPVIAHQAGWPTTNTNNTKGAYQDTELIAKRKEAGRQQNLQDIVVLAGWATASSRDWKDTGDLEKSRFRKDGKERNDTVPRQAGMALPSGTPAETGNGAGYRLNPLFSLWLMGYPAEWAYSGARAMQSFRKSRQSLSEPTLKQTDE